MASNRILIGFLPPEPSPYVVLPKNLKIKFYHLAETSLQCYRTVPSAEPSLPYIYIYIGPKLSKIYKTGIGSP